jgi:hypothetical protein
MRDPFLWSFPIGRLFGILVRIHWLAPVVALGVIFRAVKMAPPEQSGVWADATVVVILMFFVILLHEFGHCLAAHWMNGEAREVLLWPLGGLAALDVPHHPRAHFWTAFGGPGMNLVICLAAGLLLALAFEPALQPPWNPFWYPFRNGSGAIDLVTWNGTPFPAEHAAIHLVARLFWVSWLLFLFNIVLMGYPLDGGRMLQAVLWPYLGYRQAMTYALYAGFAVVVLLCLGAMVANEVLFLFLAFYVGVSCTAEYKNLDSGAEDSLFGYDFSQGYTSLERDLPAEQPAPKVKKLNFVQRWLQKRAEKKQLREQEQRAADEKRMDELLDKIQRFGKGSLTDEENRFLKKVADRYRNRN